MRRSGHKRRRQGDGKGGRRSERHCLEWWWRVCWCCWQQEIRTFPLSGPGRTHIESVWLRPALNPVRSDGWSCFEIVTLLPGTKRCPPYTSTGLQNHPERTEKTRSSPSSSTENNTQPFFPLTLYHLKGILWHLKGCILFIIVVVLFILQDWFLFSRFLFNTWSGLSWFMARDIV